MNIKPSAAIRQNYNSISDLCRATKEPVYLTKNGEGDIVVMDIQSFTRREKMLDLRARLIDIEARRLSGEKWHTPDELDVALDKAINETSKDSEGDKRDAI